MVLFHFCFHQKNPTTKFKYPQQSRVPLLKLTLFSRRYPSQYLILLFFKPLSEFFHSSKHMLQVSLHESLLFSLVKEKVLAEAIDNLGSECKSAFPQGSFIVRPLEPSLPSRRICQPLHITRTELYFVVDLYWKTY